MNPTDDQSNPNLMDNQQLDQQIQINDNSQTLQKNEEMPQNDTKEEKMETVPEQLEQMENQKEPEIKK